MNQVKTILVAMIPVAVGVAVGMSIYAIAKKHITAIQ
jgi:hypothetical protein